MNENFILELFLQPYKIIAIHVLKAGSSEQLYVEHHEEADNNIRETNNELFEDSQHITRSKAIAAKTKEIEQVRLAFL